jgi:2,3,4,5-tetrahydropyridine-2-carboxylate N-succinyltransferase
MDNIIQIIEKAYAEIDNLIHPSQELIKSIDTVMNTLDCGGIRVAEKYSDSWHVNDWIKKAILMYFKFNQSNLIDGGHTKFFDKVPLKFDSYNQEMFQEESIRVVPNAIVRKGAYIGKNTILMPCYVNIGAYVGDGSMIDTFATVGSCAQIGNNVHISGGVGIGGVLEPLQASPTIIEDNCFIGARSEIVEGVVVGHGSVISMGLYISQSTKIYNKTTGEISYGYIPPYSVVIPGSLPSIDGKYSVSAAIIIKTVDEKTRKKVGINQILREVNQ